MAEVSTHHVLLARKPCECVVKALVVSGKTKAAAVGTFHKDAASASLATATSPRCPAEWRCEIHRGEKVT